METHELMEAAEKAHSLAERRIGVTMAIVAAILGVVTLMGHRLHTEEVLLQTKATDGWAYFQAKNGRFHMYSTDAALAELSTAERAHTVAEEWKKKAEEERAQAEDIRKANEHLEEETSAAAREANYFDAAEIFLEIAIVLSSVALLTRTPLFWQLSFLPALIGVAVAAFGYVKG
jgi:hypothetical protein